MPALPSLENLSEFSINSKGTMRLISVIEDQDIIKKIRQAAKSLNASACGRSNLGPRPEAPNDSQHSIEAEWCIALSFFFNQIMTRIANRSSKDAKNTGSRL